MCLRNILKMAILFWIAFLVAGCCSAKPSKESTARPNILLILADDLGFSDIGCYGAEIHTPNLDRLATNGIRFRQMHNTSKCFPSRACLLTGVYAQQCGMGQKPLKIVNAVTLGEVLRTVGYRTLASGKHHSTESLYDRGFDRYFGLRDGAANYFNPGLQREGEPAPACKRSNRAWCIDDQLYEPYTPKEKNFYATDAFTDTALDYLEQYKDENKPFFLYLAYTAPHDPLMAWPEDIAKYEGVYDVGYAAIRKARYEKQKRMGLIDERFPLSSPTYQDWGALNDEEKADQAWRMQVYAAMVDRMDQNIGRVLNKLKQLDEFDNTLILFLSDNGSSAEDVRLGTGPIGSMTRWASLQEHWANVGNTPFRYYKNYSFEGGINTPMIAHWPAGIKNPGRFSDFTGHVIDLMPTLAEVAGGGYPSEFNGRAIIPSQGQSLAAVFEGKEVDREKPIFWQWSQGRAVRKGKWKLVCWCESDETPWQLYDMETDRTETTDLAQKHPAVVKELATLYQQWFQWVSQKH